MDLGPCILGRVAFYGIEGFPYLIFFAVFGSVVHYVSHFHIALLVGSFPLVNFMSA